MKINEKKESVNFQFRIRAFLNGFPAGCVNIKMSKIDSH